MSLGHGGHLIRGLLLRCHPFPGRIFQYSERMRLSQYPINTMKETPAEAEVISHQLMLRAGLIRRLAAGLYSWLPMGLRVLQKVERIVREEMNRAGALELVMPVIQPAELWQESGRWTRVRAGAAAHQGPPRARLRRRSDPRGSDHRHRAARAQELPPAAGELLPDPDQVPRRGAAALRRDARARVHHEGRLLLPPRRGLARAGYRAMYDAYTRIFTRTGLKFRAVRADSGAIGGDVSQEFHVLADSGEDAIVFSDGDDYAANLEAAVAAPPATPRPAPREPLRRVPTPGARTIEDGRALARTSMPARCLKTLIVEGAEGARRRAGAARRPRAERRQGAEAARSGQPAAHGERRGGARGDRHRARLRRTRGPEVPRLRRPSALALADFVCGANEKDMHLTGVNWERDVQPAAGRRPAQRGRGRSEPARARARCRSRAASRSATSSSSAPSTASR